MKIVYISNKPIYPLLDGGCIAMNQFLKCLLAAGFDVKHFTLSTQKHPFSKDHYPEKLYSIIRPETEKIDTCVKPIKALTYLVKNGSYNIDRFTDSNFKKLIGEFISINKIDVIILESIYLAGYISTIRKCSAAKIIVRAHNVEYLIWERLAKNETSFIKRLYFKKLAKDLKKEELKYLKLVDGLACISRDDKLIFRENGIKTPMTTIFVAIDKQEKSMDYNADSFYHIGSMNWSPNLEAVNWLVSSIFPAIRKELPNAKLYLAGSFMPEEFVTDNLKGIEVIGFVDDVSDFMTKKGIMLAPLKSGSGVRIKILEGMSFGVPIITTEIGAEGINGQNGTDLFISKNEEDFIKSSINLSNSKEKRASLGLNAKKYIENNYQLEPITKKIIEFIQHIS
jgi:glycosyltransferase involved in cell wall biosynthesis